MKTNENTTKMTTKKVVSGLKQVGLVGLGFTAASLILSELTPESIPNYLASGIGTGVGVAGSVLLPNKTLKTVSMGFAAGSGLQLVRNGAELLQSNGTDMSMVLNRLPDLTPNAMPSLSGLPTSYRGLPAIDLPESDYKVQTVNKSHKGEFRLG